MNKHKLDTVALAAIYNPISGVSEEMRLHVRDCVDRLMKDGIDSLSNVAKNFLIDLKILIEEGTPSSTKPETKGPGFSEKPRRDTKIVKKWWEKRNPDGEYEDLSYVKNNIHTINIPLKVAYIKESMSGHLINEKEEQKLFGHIQFMPEVNAGGINEEDLGRNLAKSLEIIIREKRREEKMTEAPYTREYKSVGEVFAAKEKENIVGEISIGESGEDHEHSEEHAPGA